MERVRLGQLGIARGDVAAPIAWGVLAALATIAQMALLSAIVARVFLTHQGLDGARLLLGLAIGAAALRAAAIWLREVGGQRAAIRGKAAVRALLFARLIALGPAYLRRQRTGALLAVATAGVDRLDPYVARYLPQRALSVLVPLLIAAAVLVRDPVSGLILLATAPIIPLLMILVGGYARGHIEAQWTALARMHAHLLEALQGLPTLTMFGRSRAEGAALARIGRGYRDRTLTTLRYAFLSGLVLEFITAGSIALLAVTLGVRLLSGGIGFEAAFFVLLLAPEFYRPLRELGLHRHAAMEGAAAASQLSAILAEPAPVPAPAPAPAVPPVVPSAARRGVPPAIALRGLWYTYPGAAAPALRGLDLELPPGARTALVGRSGSGKSTLINLLLRYGIPDSGQILVDGMPLEALPPDAWRARMAVVPQRPHLFAGSLRDNICLGRPAACRREMERAAELSGAAAFVERLPRGYETPVGERGARLSGGEAQRIAIARAFLTDAPLLILDEPTSGLDPISEALVRSALARLMADRTVLVVAHRLNTVHTAEQIAVLDDGRVVERGRHDDLLRRGGAYAALVGSRCSVAL